MSYETKQWICFVLFRFLLPLTQLGAAVVRFSGFSLLYGVLALINPLLRRPTCQSMSHYTGRYLTASLILCTLTMLAQVCFQLFCVIAPLAGHKMNWLSNCSSTESALRQLGLQRVNPDVDAVNATRIILPDVGVFAVLTAVYICCQVLLRHSSVDTSDTSGAAVPLTHDTHSESFPTHDRRRLFKYGVLIADFAGNFAIVITLGAVGIATPSVLNGVYFIVFLIVVSLWSCSIKLGQWFSVLRVAILVFVAAHLVAIHLSQFEFFQLLWQSHGNDTVLERILGLPRFVELDCRVPWIVQFSKDIKWTSFLDLGLLLSFYYILAFEIRRRMEPMQSVQGSSSVVHVAEEYVNPAVAPTETETPQPRTEMQGLITDNASPRRSYQSMEIRQDEPSQSEAINIAVAQTTEVDHHLCQQESQSEVTHSSRVAPVLFQFLANQSYIGTLIVMMAWSVIYHSWLAFVLLISACLIWIVPHKRLLCLRCSPVIVLYAICLLIIQYVYGFDLKDDELPSVVNGYHLDEIGLVKYNYAVGPLAVQVAFTLVFWLTLRQFTWELSSRRRATHPEVESLQPLSASMAKKKEYKESIGVKLLKKLGDWIHGMMCKYWIFVCGALFLFLALQKPNMFRIIYMVFFLLFVIVFQLSYTLWRYCIKVFWWIVILYSMFILACIYVFQFQNVLTRFQNSTGLSSDTVLDLGLEVYKTSDLLVQLLTPTSFLIFIILHLHYFQSTFLQISDVDRYRNGSSYNLHRNTDDDDEDEVFRRDGSFIIFWRQVITVYSSVTALLWRIAEIHIHKLVMLVIFIHCTREVSAISVVFVIILVVLMPFSRCYSVMSHVCQLYASIIIIAKMMYQLHRIPEDLAKSNCTEMRNVNTTGTGIPYPFNETIDTAKYIGFEKAANLSLYIQDYIIIVLIIAFEAIVKVHQTQHYNDSENSRPPSGIVFDGITRAKADIDLVHCTKFLINYCFYKFGREICFIMTVVTMVVRLDLYSVLYGACLGILVLISRRSCYRLWRGYVVLLMVLLIIQYLSCIGAPLAICWAYPWTPKSTSAENLNIFLYLPNFSLVDQPHAVKLIADFFQLLFVCRQLKVFATECTDDDSDEGGGCNRSVIPSFDAGKRNPRADFITYKSSYLDYAKIMVFYFSFWITLLLLFITGTSRISLFCMGYLIICFFILWFGQDMLLKPTRALHRMWSMFMMYSYLVLMTKCCLQLVGCVYIRKVPCFVSQLFGITCLQMSNYRKLEETGNETECQTDIDSAGLSWDAVSFTFLLVMTRIYKTWYFQHVVTDLLIDNQLSSRGNEMINVSLFTRVMQRKVIEQSIVAKIRRKMERIKMRHYRLHKGSVAEPTDHYVVIRSGDYYMFDDISDDEDVRTDISEEQLELMTPEMYDFELKKPGPLQIINAGITSGAKGALDLWRRQSFSSTESGDEKEVKGGAFDHRPSSDDHRRLSYGNAESWKPSPGAGVGEPSSAPSPTHAGHVPVVVEDASDRDSKEPVTSGITNICMVFWVILCSALEKLVAVLNGISYEYRNVSCRLAKEKARAKARRQQQNQTSSVVDEPHAVATGEEDPELINIPSTRPNEIYLHIDGEENQFDTGPNGNGQQQQKFESEMPLPVRLIKATFEVLLSHSELLCYFAMVLNAMVVGSVCSIVYPILAFLWAMLSEPRPSKSFWVFAITYTEVLIVVKYLFQFNFYPWNNPSDKIAIEFARTILSPPVVFGIEKKETYAAFDLFLLFSLFIHRSILKQHGLWKDAVSTSDDLKRAENVVASMKNTPVSSPKDPFKVAGFLQSQRQDQSDGSNQAAANEISMIHEIDDVDAGHNIHCDEEDIDTTKELVGCWQMLSKSFLEFYDQLTHPKFSAATDVYAFMFTCDLITFIIVVFGYASFGPSVSAGAGAVVTSVIKQNRVPGPFLGMLLAQFILTIIDRALYLRKQVFGKFCLQILLVLLVHGWMFFALPYIASRRFTQNTVAQLWYFTKCIYFALSAYQIRCGYPTRILGNFLTKKHNYLNLYCFKGFLVIPFLLELRALMDWMFTDTTLALTSWLQMEDIFSSVFCIKCDRQGEKTFPVARGRKRRAIIKYGLGGLLLFLLIFIIWFPLLLFSLSETIFIPDPPIDITVNIQFWGYQPLFTMSAQQNSVASYTQEDYDALYEGLQDSRGQSFLMNYFKEDICKAEISGTSGSTWDISPPNIRRLRQELRKGGDVSMYVAVSFTREPSPGLTTETVNGRYVRTFYRSNKTDNDTMHAIADMLEGSVKNRSQSVQVTKLYPHYWTVPASGKAAMTEEVDSVANFWGNVSLQLYTDDNSNAKWWTVNDMNATGAGGMSVTSFNQRIAPSSVISKATSYGVIGLYVSLVLVIGQFVRLWVQGLSFRIMFVELPNPDLLLKLCLDIYMVRESGELSLEEDLFSQLIFLYRSPETLIKVTKRKQD